MELLSQSTCAFFTLMSDCSPERLCWLVFLSTGYKNTFFPSPSAVDIIQHFIFHQSKRWKRNSHFDLYKESFPFFLLFFQLPILMKTACNNFQFLQYVGIPWIDETWNSTKMIMKSMWQDVIFVGVKLTTLESERILVSVIGSSSGHLVKTEWVSAERIGRCFPAALKLPWENMLNSLSKLTLILAEDHFPTPQESAGRDGSLGSKSMFCLASVFGFVLFSIMQWTPCM